MLYSPWITLWKVCPAVAKEVASSPSSRHAFARRISNETKPHVAHRLSALDPAYDASPDQRYDPCQARDVRGRGLNPRCSPCPGSLAVRNAAACGTPVGAHHHAPRVDNWDRHAGRPRHEPS